MNRFTLLLAVILGSVSGCDHSAETSPHTGTASNTEAKLPPAARKIPHELEAHGRTRIDNYYWMRDDTRSDPEVLAHLAAENAYTEAALAHLAPLRESLFEELVGRLEKDRSTVPVLDRGYWYYARYSGKQEYPVHARSKTLQGEEQILLDGNAMAEDHDYFAIGSYDVSADGNILAYSTDTLSRRLYDIRFKDIASGSEYLATLKNTNGQVVWANDNRTVYYLRKDPTTLRAFQVYRHQLGSSQAQDILVYEETDPEFRLVLGKAKDDSLIFLYHNSTRS